jgi:WD40 repeat protein
MPAIERFTTAVVDGTRTPWLRPMQTTLHPPGTSLIRTLEGHSASVTGLALSGDGRRAVSASDDNTLKVWDVERGELLATFTCAAAAMCCAFINDCKMIAGDAGAESLKRTRTRAEQDPIYWTSTMTCTGAT